MLYQYLAKDISGEFIKGQIESEDHKRALHVLREKKLFVIEIKRVQVQTSFSLLRRKVGPKDLALLCNQLTTLIKAGISITKSLETVAEKTENKDLRKAIKDIIKDLEGGNTLTESVKKHEDIFPQIFISLMEAGEAGGMLETIIERLADYFESEREIREKVKSAMTYPLFIGVFALVAMVLMLIFIVPNFIGMFEDMGVGNQLPLITRMLISVSNFVRSNILLIAIFIVGLGFGVTKLMERPNIKIRWDYKKTNIPIFGNLIKRIAVSRFCRTMALMTASNVDIISSLQLSSKAVENDSFGEEILDALVGVQEGSTLADGLRKSKFIDSITLQMLTVGEETGNLDQMLEKMGVSHEQDVKYNSDRMGSLIEPVMIIMVALMVGIILAAVMLPMFDLMQFI